MNNLFPQKGDYFQAKRFDDHTERVELIKCLDSDDKYVISAGSIRDKKDLVWLRTDFTFHKPNEMLMRHLKIKPETEEMVEAKVREFVQTFVKDANTSQKDWVKEELKKHMKKMICIANAGLVITATIATLVVLVISNLN